MCKSCNLFEEMCVYVRGLLRENIFLSLIQLTRGIKVKADLHLLINKNMEEKVPTNLSEVIMVNFNRLSLVSFSFLAKKKTGQKIIINGS